MVLFLVILLLILLLVSSIFFNPRKSKKKFIIIFFVISSFSISIYWLVGNEETFHFDNKIEDEIQMVVNNPERLGQINPQKIIYFLETKLNENPYDLEGWKLLARTCLITGHNQKAELYFTNALKYFPLNEEILLEYAVLKKNTNQLTGAIKLLNKIDLTKTQKKNAVLLYFELLERTKKFKTLNQKLDELKKNKEIEATIKKEISEKYKLR